MNYRKEFQEDLDYHNDGYKIKTNKELINIISDFGLGETEFHTVDIERLIKEHSMMLSILKTLIEDYRITAKDETDSLYENDFINKIRYIIELYSE